MYMFVPMIIIIIIIIIIISKNKLIAKSRAVVNNTGSVSLN